ncbi:MAG: hypothetical protein M1834_003778 [Cirrosporium novae-zelandiae]|nr:MAG: hypothetical protein M1834_003778 [Cirrosporium novae-zelandiae]
MASYSQSQPRYIKPTITHSSSHPLNPYTHLLSTLSSLLSETYPHLPHLGPRDYSGLFYGPTSIAYLLFRLSLSHPELKASDRTIEDWAELYLGDRGLPGEKEIWPVDSTHCGIANERLSSLAVRAALKHDKACAINLLEYTDIVLSGEKAGSNELLFGKAGYLYLLKMVKRFVEDPKIQDAINKKILDTGNRILEFGPPWIWHGKQYLGAVHGEIGIITQMLQAQPAFAPKVQAHLKKLLDLQMESGNWPSSLGESAKKDVLVQFCHGAPGFVASLLAIRQYVPELSAEISEAIEKGRDTVWMRGLLTKEPCLCHGATGNALCMDEERREEMLRFGMEDVVREGLAKGTFVASSKPWGLYTGLAGRVWAWMALEGKGNEGIIGYSDLIDG